MYSTRNVTSNICLWGSTLVHLFLCEQGGYLWKMTKGSKSTQVLLVFSENLTDHQPTDIHGVGTKSTDPLVVTIKMC